MASISLKLDKHPRLTPMEEVKISWIGKISVKRLKDYLDGNAYLLPGEQAVWNMVKDQKCWLYCFMGRLDTMSEINGCYVDAKKKEERINFMISEQKKVSKTKIYYGTDIRLDFGKVDTQTIEERTIQHFNDDDYLEGYRRDAVICFPEEIDPYDENYAGDFIDTLETILINGHTDETTSRLGVCNIKKTIDPKLHYPIMKVCNLNGGHIMEKEICVNIEE